MIAFRSSDLWPRSSWSTEDSRLSSYHLPDLFCVRRYVAQVRRVFHAERNLVHVAPEPILSRLEGLHDRVISRPCVCRRMLALRRVAATHVTTGHAQPQVHPLFSAGETFDTPIGLGSDVADLIDVGTRSHR